MLRHSYSYRQVLLAALFSLIFGPLVAAMPPTLVYGIDSTLIPYYRTWDGTGWSAPGSTLNISQSAQWAVAKACPGRTENVAAFSDDQDDINAMVYDGSTWSHLLELTTNLGTHADRPFDVAYQQLSGHALVCYRTANDFKLHYRIWDGLAWSSEGSTITLSTNKFTFVKLTPKPGSDEIVAMVLGANKDVIGLVWNGGAFGNVQTLETDASYTGEECFAAAYERTSGRCMVAWAKNGSNQPRYAIWSGAAWLATSSAPSIGSEARWLRLAGDPVSNTLIMFALDNANDYNAIVWSGSAWGSAVQFAGDAPNHDRRGMDVEFERTGTKALALYSRSAVTGPCYRTFDGASWSAELLGPGIGVVPGIIQTQPTSGSEIFVTVREKDNRKLHFMRWNGTSLTDNQLIESDLGGDKKYEDFMCTDLGRSRLASWQEVQP